MIPMIDTENVKLSIWNDFFKTDPSYTKDFTRGGGFKGTAVTPMLAAFKMTSKFGPMGEGWGIDIVKYEMVTAKLSETESELLIFMLVGLWYVNEAGVKCVAGPQWGGDKVTVNTRGGMKSDDEAFKKATTDGFMKCAAYLGIGADIHSGMFDDLKYFSSLESEFVKKEEKQSARPRAAKTETKDVSGGEAITAEDVKNKWLEIYAVEEKLGNSQEFIRGEATKKQATWLKDIPETDKILRRQTTYKEQCAWLDIASKALKAKEASKEPTSDVGPQ